MAGTRERIAGAARACTLIFLPIKVHIHVSTPLEIPASQPAPALTRAEQMLRSAPLPLLLRMASPNALAFIVQGSVSMMEVWYVGRLGTQSLAAIALVFPALMLMQTLANGAIGGAVTSALARALGAGQRARAQALIWHALIIAIGASTTFWMLWLLLGRAALDLLVVAPGVVDEAVLYGNVLFAGAVTIWIMALMAAVFRATGDMRFPAMLMVLGAGVQIPLSGTLVLGWFGVPSLGIVGAAVSTITVAGMSSAVLLWRLARGRGVAVRLERAAAQLDRRLFADIFRVGAPASLSPLFTVLTIVLANVIVARFGAASLAGYGIAARLEFLLIPLIFGLGAAMTTLVGTNIGAGNVVRAERIAWVGSSCAAGLAGMAGIVLALRPGLWVSLFTDDPAVWSAGAAFLQIVGPVFAFQGLGLSLYFASQGAGRVAWPVMATVLRFVVAIGGGALLVVYGGFGLEAAYAAIAAGMVLYGVITAASVAGGAWRA
jgi:putative MATE family efflux protein